MIDALNELYYFIFNIVIGFLDLASATYNVEPWENIMITPGIGAVTWFTVSLYDLIGIVLFFVIVITLIRYTVKFVKWIWSFASRLFGGR